jgi:hypothetical protein
MVNESKILKLIKRQKATVLTIIDFGNNEVIAKSISYFWCKKAGHGYILEICSLPCTHSQSKASKEHYKSRDSLPMEISYPNFLNTNNMDKVIKRV